MRAVSWMSVYPPGGLDTSGVLVAGVGGSSGYWQL